MLFQAHESAMRASDMRQSEVFLKGRIDELESSEVALKEALKDREQTLYQKERKFREKVKSAHEEIIKLVNIL